jgi:competence protein ComEA
LLLLALVLGAGSVQAAEPPPLDLNRASAEELEALPGIGAVKAAAILAVREERGGFESLDELESVRGIGPKLAQKLRPMLRVGAAKPGGGSGKAGSGPGTAKR